MGAYSPALRLSSSEAAALKDGDTFSYPRVKAVKRDGTTIWLHLTCSYSVKPGQDTICYATVLDVTHTVDVEQSVGSLKGLATVLATSSDVITFEYDVLSRGLSLSFVYKESMRQELKVPDFLSYLKSTKSKVDAEDRERLATAIEDASAKRTSGEINFRAVGPDGAHHYYHCKYFSLVDSDTIYRLTGIIDQIDDIMKVQETLLSEAQIDNVTGLKSKDYARREVEELLNRREKGTLDAILFMDIDNFKQINDTIGHLEADKVLTMIGRILHSSFRGSDLASRFGGDEFLVYLIGVSSRKDVEMKADEIIGRINKMKVNGVDSVHCSVGIALIDDEVKDFDTAFSRANKAMYHSKEKGKNTKTFYADMPKDKK